MQYPAGIDQIERSLDRYKLQDIGLGVLDSPRQRRGRLPPPVAETSEAENDRQHPPLLILACHLDRIAARAAAGPPNVHAAPSSTRAPPRPTAVLARAATPR